MAKTVLGNLLVSGLTGQSEARAAHSEFLGALGKYLEGSVTLVGTFSGAIPGSPPTPGTFPTINKLDASLLYGQVLFCSPDSSNNGGPSEWIDWVTRLYGLIRSYCYVSVGPANPIGTIPAFSRLMVPSWSRSELVDVVNGSDPQGEAMDIIARGIMKDLQVGFTMVWPATYGGYTIPTPGVTVSSVNCL